MTARDIAGDAGQVLWIGFAGPDLDDGVRRRIAEGACGAVILFKRNLRFAGETCDLDHLVALDHALHAEGDVLVCVDQEGGPVQRVRAPATVWPAMLAFERHGGAAAALAEEVGLALGRELAALGFDVDFAPVLDVHSNPANPIIGERAFGHDAATVTERALAFARGLAGAGILACGKHFPGHGDTSTDSHLELPRIDHPLERLERVELAPFAAAARARVPMIMTAHVVFSALDPSVPATLSRKVMTDLLRGRLGYDGVIVSDDLDMRAIADHFGADAAVGAIAAGCDVLLLCEDEQRQDDAHAALIHRAEADSAFRARLGEAAARVRALKAEHGGVARPDRTVVGCDAHRALAARLLAG